MSLSFLSRFWPHSSSRDKCEMYEGWIHEIALVLEQAASGNLEPRLLNINVPGEFGQVLCDLNRVLDVADAYVRESNAALQHVTENKYYRKVIERGLPGTYRQGAAIINHSLESSRRASERLAAVAGERTRMADEFESTIKSMVDSVASTATQLSETAELISQRAEATNTRASEMSSAFQSSSRNVVSIASAIEELSTSIVSIEGQVEASNLELRNAVDCSERSSQTVSELAQAGAKIGDVVGLIRDIAKQTNLLALNATIEAASAGDAGRGFAVVAGEVKSLAGQTGGATNEIAEQVEGIRAVTAEIVSSIDEIGRAIAKLEETSGTCLSAMGEQGKAATEISQATQDVAATTQQVSDSIEGVSTDAAEATVASRELLESANELSKVAEGVRGEVASFLDALRG